MKTRPAIKITGGLAALALAGLLAACGTASTNPAVPARVEAKAPKAKTVAVKAERKPSMTAGQRNALASAEDYLATEAFSKKGLTEQLSSDAGEGFPKADARWAVGHVKADWMAQAVKTARDYLDMQSFSRDSLREQLTFDGYTPSQAAHGVAVAYQ